jgi:hypothetical protein
LAKQPDFSKVLLVAFRDEHAAVMRASLTATNG